MYLRLYDSERDHGRQKLSVESQNEFVSKVEEQADLESDLRPSSASFSLSSFLPVNLSVSFFVSWANMCCQ